MGATWILARATYGLIVRQPLYYILLGVLALLVFVSQYLTIFALAPKLEIEMMREMGIATLSLWGLLVFILNIPSVVIAELEDRTAVTLLSKPLSRTQFLLGKLGGLLMAILVGQIFLALILILVLWNRLQEPWIFPHVWSEAYNHLFLAGKTSVWVQVWNEFIKKDAWLVLQGIFLSGLYMGILGALAVSFAVFFPALITIVLTMLVYTLGNLTPYIKSGLAQTGSAPLDFLGQAVYTLMPNFSLMTPQSYFSEGRPLSLLFLAEMAIYAMLYSIVVLLISTGLFRKREIR